MQAETGIGEGRGIPVDAVWSGFGGIPVIRCNCEVTLPRKGKLSSVLDLQSQCLNWTVGKQDAREGSCSAPNVNLR
jgi:hypothetical protein